MRLLLLIENLGSLGLLASFKGKECFRTGVVDVELHQYPHKSCRFLFVCYGQSHSMVVQIFTWIQPLQIAVLLMMLLTQFGGLHSLGNI